MKKILMTIVAFGSLLLAGCEASEIPGTPYNGPDYVYFEITTDNTVEIVFEPKSSTVEKEVMRNVLVAGKYVEDRDRTFKIVAEMAPGSEKYDISKLIRIDTDTYTVGKGEIDGQVTFTLLNDKEYLQTLKGLDFYALVKIAPTDDFADKFEYQTLSIHFWISGEY